MTENAAQTSSTLPVKQDEPVLPLLKLPVCEGKHHFNKNYTWVCSNPNCTQQRIACSKCLAQTHRNCINYAVHLDDLATLKYTNNPNYLHNREIREAALLLEKFGLDDDMNDRMLREFELSINKEFDDFLQHVTTTITETKTVLLDVFKKNLGSEKFDPKTFFVKLQETFSLESLYKKCEELSKGVKSLEQINEDISTQLKSHSKAKEQELETLSKDIVGKIVKNTGLDPKVFTSLRTAFDAAIQPIKHFNPQKKSWKWSAGNKSNHITLQEDNTKAVKTGSQLTYAAVVGDTIFKENKQIWEIKVEAGNTQAQWVSFGVVDNTLASNWDNFNYSQTIGMTTYGQFYQMNKTTYQPGAWDKKTYRCELDLTKGKFEIYLNNNQIATSTVNLKGKNIVPFVILYRYNNTITLKVIQ